jgi:hypothetical protein
MAADRMMRTISIAAGAVLLAGVLHLATPRASWACGCCACDLGGGDVECGDFDPDCGICIVIGGHPAADCSACTNEPVCDDQTLCSGDPDQCSTGVTGACCVTEPAGGARADAAYAGRSSAAQAPACFELTAVGCASTGGTYHGDGSTCADTSCAVNAPAPVLSQWALVVTALALAAVALMSLRRRRI